MDRTGIKYVCIDFHGVLTDGRQSISHDGKYLFDHIHCRDVRSIRELIAKGYEVYIVTSSSSAIIKHFAEKVGAEVLVLRDKGKIFDEPYIAIGDDSWDVRMLEAAVQKYCPADADYSVRSIPGINILETKGGRGVIAELISKFGL